MRDLCIFKGGMSTVKLNILLLLFFMLIGSDQHLYADEFGGVAIVTGEKASSIEKRVANLLEERLQEFGMETVAVSSRQVGSQSAEENLNVFLGVAERHTAINSILIDKRIPAVDRSSPGPEGFLTKYIKYEKEPAVLICGADDRGCLGDHPDQRTFPGRIAAADL